MIGVTNNSLRGTDSQSVTDSFDLVGRFSAVIFFINSSFYLKTYGSLSVTEVCVRRECRHNLLS